MQLSSSVGSAREGPFPRAVAKNINSYSLFLSRHVRCLNVRNDVLLTVMVSCSSCEALESVSEEKYLLRNCHPSRGALFRRQTVATLSGIAARKLPRDGFRTWRVFPRCRSCGMVVEETLEFTGSFFPVMLEQQDRSYS